MMKVLLVLLSLGPIAGLVRHGLTMGTGNVFGKLFRISTFGNWKYPFSSEFLNV